MDSEGVRDEAEMKFSPLDNSGFCLISYSMARHADAEYELARKTLILILA